MTFDILWYLTFRDISCIHPKSKKVCGVCSPVQNILRKKYVNFKEIFSTKVRKSWNEAKMYKNVGLLTTRTCSLDIYGVSSQHFDTSLKLLLFLTKLNRADLVVFAFSDYKFAENQNNLRSVGQNYSLLEQPVDIPINSWWKYQ